MEVISDRSRLRELLTKLDGMSEDPRKNTVLCTIKSHLRDLLAIEAVVDQWPDVRNFVLDKIKQKNLGFSRKDWFVFASNLESFERFVQQPGVIFWNDPIKFQFVPPELEPVLMRTAKKNGGEVIRDPSAYFVLTFLPREKFSSQLKVIHCESSKRLPPGFTVGSLGPEHAQTVLNNWVYMKYQDKSRKEDLLREYQHVLSRSPSCCIFNPEGQPVAWSMNKTDGSSGMSHTLEEYRGLGLYQTVYLCFTLMNMQYNSFIYGVTDEKNAAVIHVNSKLGSALSEKVVFLRYTPPKSQL